MSNFQKYTNFDTMITPMIIKILFWVGVVASVLAGLGIALPGLGLMAYSGFEGFITFIGGLIVIAIGLLVTRVYCELLIIFFKMHESLQRMNEKLDELNGNQQRPIE